MNASRLAIAILAACALGPASTFAQQAAIDRPPSKSEQKPGPGSRPEIPPSATALPSTPEELMQRLDAALRAKDFTAYFSIYDPDAVEKFKVFLLGILRRAEDAGNASGLYSLYGVSAAAEFEFLPAPQAVARFFGKFFDMVPFAGSPGFQVIGSVEEGPDVRHFVVRAQMGGDSAPLDVVGVQSARRTSSGWVAIPGMDLRQLTAAISQYLGKTTAPKEDGPHFPGRDSREREYQRESVGAVALGPDLTPPERIKKVDPDYPESARRLRLEGRVVLQAIIDEDGRVSAVRALKGPEELVVPSVDAVRQWRYKPALKNGKPVKIVFTVQVEFTLNRGEKAPPPR